MKFPEDKWVNEDIEENITYMYPISMRKNNMYILTGYIVGYDPYIKVLKYESLPDYDKIINVCRLSMYNPEYIIGLDENYILTKEELNYVYNILNKQIRGISEWDKAVKYLKEYDKNIFNSIREIPNYHLLLR